jgi:hypothetical protein
MRQSLTNFGVAVAVLVCAVVAAVVGWELGRPSHHAAHPPAAATVLHQAATAMEAVTSYQFSGQLTIGIETLKLSGEFSAPDHLHETLTLPGVAPVERVLIGTAVYQRTGSGWQRAAASATSSDPRTTFGALAGVTEVSANGSVYSFSLTGAATSALISGVSSSSTITGTVTIDVGRIVDVSYRSAAGAGTTVTFSYAGLNTTPPVTAPPGVA